VRGFQTHTYEEIKAAVDAAHALGNRIAIHSYGARGPIDAVRAGTDSLEHRSGRRDDSGTDNYKMLGYPAGSVA